jgi:hypothetical protein
MKSLLIAAVVATSFAAVGAQNANSAGNHSYAYQYCHYYKARALGAHSLERKDYMWAKYRACLREYGAY